jgi:hypothetical protein
VRVLRIAAPAALALLMLVAASAPAQVFIDPDSPSAKEYAIPLERERRQADPDVAPGGGVVQGDRSSPLFGAGIEPGEASSGGSDSAAQSPSGAGRGGAEPNGAARSGSGAVGGARDATAGDPPDAVRAAAANPGAPDGGIGTPLLIAGIAAAVLAIGGAAGFLLRRRD